MAKPLMVTLGTETFSFSLNEVERADLYGSRKRVPTDASGRTCTRAGLTQDGSLLIASGMSGQVGQGGAAHLVGGAHRALELRAVMVPGQFAIGLALLGVEGIGRKRVVHHHVQAAELGHHRLHQRRGRLRVAHVGLNRQRIAARITALLRYRFG